MNKIYIIRALLPDTSGNGSLRKHYFQGIADVVRPANQPGGLSGMITVNAWTQDLNACAGFMLRGHAEAYLKVIDLKEAQISIWGYYDSDSNQAYYKNGKPRTSRPNHILDGNTGFRIIIMPPPNHSPN